MAVKSDIIGNELKLFRIKNRVSAQLLARHSKISPSMISKIENGWANISETVLDALLKGYQKIDDVKGAPQFLRQIQAKLN